MLAFVMSVQLLPADHFGVAVRADLINAAYAGYYVPMHLTAESMKSVDELYDVDLARSVVAHVRGEPVGMALLSRRGERGWISGVGVLPAWRQRGLGRTMTAAVLDNAREAGLAHVSLEVITQNTAGAGALCWLGLCGAARAAVLAPRRRR